MPKLISDKMGLRNGMSAYFRNAPKNAIEHISPPALALKLSSALRGKFDDLHLFVTAADELDRAFPELRDHLDAGGRLFVSWPKSRQLGSDLTIRRVIEIGYSHGLVESTALSIDSTWSALKFTWPKPGKTYKNSYGKLPDAPSQT